MTDREFNKDEKSACADIANRIFIILKDYEIYYDDSYWILDKVEDMLNRKYVKKNI